MAGLTSNLPQPPAAAPPAPVPGQPPQPITPPPGGPQRPAQAAQPKGPPITEGPVDPELLKKMLANCMNTVTGGLPQIIKMVQQSDDKVAALAQAAVFSVIRVEDSLEQAGGQLNLAMTFEAGAETLTDIADAMQKAGVYTYSQKEMDAAFLRAVDQYRLIRAKQGRLDPAMFKAKIDQMKQAQADGTLDQQYPGLTEFAKQSQKAAKPAYKAGGAQPPTATDDGDGADAEDVGDQQDDAGEVPAAGQNIPTKMLPAKKGHINVKAHLRQRKGAAAPKLAPAKKPHGINDFPAAMLDNGKAAAPAKAKPGRNPKKKGGF